MVGQPERSECHPAKNEVPGHRFFGCEHAQRTVRNADVTGTILLESEHKNRCVTHVRAGEEAANLPDGFRFRRKAVCLPGIVPGPF